MTDPVQKPTDCPAGGRCDHGEFCETRGCLRLDPPMIGGPPPAVRKTTAKPEKRIVTDCVFPPIPIRCFDWQAWFDGEEEDGCYGYGATEAEAISELLAIAPDDEDAHDAR